MLFGIAHPALFDLEIQQGQITPVKVELQKTGEVAVRSKDTSYGGSAYGRYGRRTRIAHDQSAVYRVKASAQPARPYAPKERME